MGFNTKRTNDKSKNPEGTDLTNEQVSDVYTAGTSDGIIDRGNEKIQIKNNKNRK